MEQGIKNSLTTAQLLNKIAELESENKRLKERLRIAEEKYPDLKLHSNQDTDLHCLEERITKEKARSFFMYFWGRTDVFAKRAVNRKTGKAGYYPQCINFWRIGPIRKSRAKSTTPPGAKPRK